MSVPVSVLIPTFDEELNLPDCLGSVAGWSDDVWVIDSFSRDKTAEIARAAGAKLVEHAFEGYSQQKNWALDTLPLAYPWVLILDADERLTPELAAEISAIAQANGGGCDGFYLNRRFVFYGKWIRHCGWYPSWNLRLFRRGAGRYENRELHEHVILDGKAGYCKHDLIHEDLRDMSEWIAKHNSYSSKEAREQYRILLGEAQTGFKPSLFKGSVERKRFVKERIWPRLPGRAFLYFLYLYFFRLGFLDGKHGLHFCLMHAIFEEFNTIKLWELRHFKQGAPVKGICAPRVFTSPIKAEIAKPAGSEAVQR